MIGWGNKSSSTALNDPNARTLNATPIVMKTSTTTSGVIRSRQNETTNNTGSTTKSSSTSNEMTNENVVLKSGWMTKRSQLKSIFSFTNYRERYFQLTKSALIYYENAPPITTTAAASTHGKNKKGSKQYGFIIIQLLHSKFINIKHPTCFHV